jgi:ribosomal protein L12E/L44/L45/RPP1/RPP2
MANSNFKLKKYFSSFKNKDISKSWLYCRWVLYLLFVLAIGNIYYLIMHNDVFTLAVFILVAFLTTFFSKNMVVILCISLVISTILKSVQVKEGLGFKLSNNDLNTIETLVEKLSNIREGNISGNAKPSSASISLSEKDKSKKSEEKKSEEKKSEDEEKEENENK